MARSFPARARQRSLSRRRRQPRRPRRPRGLATRTAFEFPQRILWEYLDDFVLVSEDDLARATLLMLETTRNLVEPAGAAAVAAVRRDPERFAGRRVAVICSGGNIAPAPLRALLER